MNTPFNKNAYLAFDGTSFRDLLIQKLNQGGVFTDQNYEGSHLAALNDIIGYFYSTLVFYLNQSAAGSQFAETQIYENMNRLVKLINYKPIGRVTQSVGISIYANQVAQSLAAGNYAIPRYSNISVGGNFYSFSKDISFSVTSGELELVSEDQYFIHQGLYQEHPSYTAVGVEHETLYVTSDETDFIDHYQLDVYVKSVKTNTWSQWRRTENLLTETMDQSVYEVRFNENKRYEIKFGDGVNGSKLTEGDTVQVYYLKINPNSSDLAANAIAGTNLILFKSVKYTAIIPQVSLVYSNFLTSTQTTKIQLDNNYPSTGLALEETVEDIRINAPGSFRSQSKLDSAEDYKFWIMSRFGSFLSDVYIVNNEEYLNNHIKYFYNEGITNPNTDQNILLNQVFFSNGCNFNNIYIYMVPKKGQLINIPQKRSILDSLKPVQSLLTQVIPMDPEYMELLLCVAGDEKNIDQTPNILQITKEPNTRKSNKSIQTDVENVLMEYFDRENFKLGGSVDLSDLSTRISNIEGVDKIKTYSPTLKTESLGISMLLRNIKYPNIQQAYTQNIPLQFFQYPIWTGIGISNQIQIQEVSGSIKSSEF